MEIPQAERNRIAELPYRLRDKLTEILDGFKWAISHKNTSAVMIMDGRSGMGKTTLAFQIAKYCDPNFNLGQVYFTPEEFLGGLSTAQPGSVHVFDEAMLISSRSAMSQVNRAAVQAMSMIRSKKIIVIFCVNSIFDLDRNLALSRADILLNVYGDSLTDRGKFMAFFKGMDGQDRLKMLYLLGKKYYDYSKPKSNFNTTFSSYFVLNEEEYERKKQEGVNRFLSGGEQKYSRDTFRQSRDAYVKWILDNTELTQEHVAEIGGITRQTIYNILHQSPNSL